MRQGRKTHISLSDSIRLTFHDDTLHNLMPAFRQTTPPLYIARRNRSCDSRPTRNPPPPPPPSRKSAQLQFQLLRDASVSSISLSIHERARRLIRPLRVVRKGIYCSAPLPWQINRKGLRGIRYSAHLRAKARFACLRWRVTVAPLSLSVSDIDFGSCCTATVRNC